MNQEETSEDGAGEMNPEVDSIDEVMRDRRQNRLLLLFFFIFCTLCSKDHEG